MTRARGRPTKYDPAFIAVAGNAAELGGTNREIADALDVSISTLNLWASTYPDFSAALKQGKEAADLRVERSLYHRAVGYSHEAVKLQVVDGEVVSTPYIEHYPPDTTAGIFWLKNRRPDLWRDKQQVEHSGNVSLVDLLSGKAGEGV